MARTGWLGLPKLPALAEWSWRREDDAAAPQGLVLAGGGSRASFEIGALTYLYDQTDFHPTAIAGTSAGAIVAAMLAQSADRDAQRRILTGLAEIWRELQTSSDMFAERQWFQRLSALRPDLEAMFDDDDDDPLVPAERLWRLSLPALPPLPAPLRRRPTSEEHEAEAAKEPGPDQHFHPLLGFGPESEEIGRDAGWTPQAFGQAVSLVQALGRAGGDIPLILHGAERTRAMYRPGRILRRLLAPEFFSPDRVAASGVTLRIALVCLETGQLRYLRQDGVIVDRDDTPVPGLAPVDLTLGTLASCSIPSVFAPVPLGGQHYVDGGVRENLPVEACLGHLGAKRPIVIVCAPAGLAENGAVGGANLFGIMGRAVAIMADECLRDEVALARTAGALVIEPEVDVHDAMVVDPGLIDINLAYGWMRAQEASTRAAAAEIKLHRDVVMARQRAWALERELYAPDARPVHDGLTVLTELAEVKYRVRDLVADARPGLFPAGADEWWLDYERHPWPIEARPPWRPLEPPTPS